MNKIDFVNNQEPAINAENLNAVQTNTENAIDDVQEQLDGLVKNIKTASESNVYSCEFMNNMFKIFAVTFYSGAINANSDLYDKSHVITSNEIPDTYTPIGIVGESKGGLYYSHAFFSRLYVGGTDNRTIYWALKNTSSTSIGGNGLALVVYVLAVKN